MDDIYGVVGTAAEEPWTHVWRTKQKHPKRFGRRVRVLGTHGKQYIVEFEDKFQCFAHASQVRKLRIGEE